jgi:GntR family transcriptional regulator
VLDEGRPIYLQIAELLREEIVRGRLLPDAAVPSTNEYARTLRINPATAGKGLQTLVDEGLLYRRRGVGTFVHPDARTRLLEERRGRFFRDVVDPVVAEAEAIGVDIGDVIAHLRCVADPQP